MKVTHNMTHIVSVCENVHRIVRCLSSYVTTQTLCLPTAVRWFPGLRTHLCSVERASQTGRYRSREEGCGTVSKPI